MLLPSIFGENLFDDWFDLPDFRDLDRVEKKLYGKVSMGVVRTTFIIGEDGKIEKIMPKVKPDTNAAEILAEL